MRYYTYIAFLILTFLSCKSQDKKESTMTEINDWKRERFEQPLDSAYLFYVVYGDFKVDFKLSGEKYQTKGIPNGIDLMHYGPETHPEVLESFLEGYVWDELNKDNLTLSNQIKEAKECYIFKGSVADTDNLNYYRDLIGLITYLLDNGGVAVYDLQVLTFWSKTDWIEKIFEPKAPQPRQHVLIIFSEEENGTKWFHTRGLRKYGRSDLSIHNVSKENENAIVDLINRLIDFQAHGGIVDKDFKIDMKPLPKTMWCEQKGDFEDPDFNNKHIEIHWK